MDFNPGKLFQWGNELSGFKFGTFTNTKEVIDFYGAVHLSPLGFDQKNSVYRFITVSQQTSLETVQSVELMKYKDISNAYSSSPYTGISQVRITVPYEGSFNFYSALAKSFGDEKRIEFDFSDFVNISNYEIRQVALRYLIQFSFIYATLTVPSHYFKFDDFEEGKFYQVSDINKFYTYQNDSDAFMCISKDDKDITFAVVRDITKFPICPGVPVTVASGVASFGWSSEEFFIEDFLHTSPEDDLETAKLYEYNLNYFAVDDFISLEKVSTGTKYSKKINAISGDDITLNSAPVGGDGEYWLFWDNYSIVNTRQQKFFFYNVNNW